MNEEEVFREELAKIKEMIQSGEGELSKETVKEVFSRMDLDESQLEMIMEYLKGKLDGDDEEGSEEKELASEDSKYLSLYLEEIRGLKTLTDGQKRALFMAAVNGEKPAKEELMEGLLTQVVDIAKMYAGQGVPMEDLIGEGNVALAVSMEVIEQEDDPKEAEEMVAAMIMKAMEELVNEDSLSKDAFEEWAEKANEVLDKAEEMSKELLRKVTISELCNEAGFTEEFVREVINVTGGKIEYLDLENNS
ncbi:MAG: hypothetical protein IKI20_09190 [Lachnospiraceae bacterium]|nr:hypothetical protein [Lachnospiraceae bacterium]